MLIAMFSVYTYTHNVMRLQMCMYVHIATHTCTHIDDVELPIIEESDSSGCVQPLPSNTPELAVTPTHTDTHVPTHTVIATPTRLKSVKVFPPALPLAKSPSTHTTKSPSSSSSISEFLKYPNAVKKTIVKPTNKSARILTSVESLQLLEAK